MHIDLLSVNLSELSLGLTKTQVTLLDSWVTKVLQANQRFSNYRTMIQEGSHTLIGDYYWPNKIHCSGMIECFGADLTFAQQAEIVPPLIRRLAARGVTIKAGIVSRPTFQVFRVEVLGYNNPDFAARYDAEKRAKRLLEQLNFPL